MSTEIWIMGVASIFIVLGAILWQKGTRLLSGGRKASAIIFKNDFEKGNYYPVVRFKTDNDVWITKQLNVGYSTPTPEGKKVEVIYNPDDPTDASINSTFILVWLPRLFVAIGATVFVFGILEYLEIVNLAGSQ